MVRNIENMNTLISDLNIKFVQTLNKRCKKSEKFANAGVMISTKLDLNREIAYFDITTELGSDVFTIVVDNGYFDYSVYITSTNNDKLKNYEFTTQCDITENENIENIENIVMTFLYDVFNLLDVM